MSERTQGVVVVTGASAGLGRAAARRFAERGWSVAALARGADGLHGVSDELTAIGVRHVALPVDVADMGALRAAAATIEEDLGPIEVWVNDAMTSVFSPFCEMDIADFERATTVDYLGFVHGTRAALERMSQRDRGVIVQVSSALAFRSIPLQSAYCGAKHAIVGFTEALRVELMHDHRHVQLSMVHMPALNTPQFGWVRSTLPRQARPVAPVYQPEVGARAIVFAAEHPRRDLYVGASTVLTVFGNRVAPGLLDRYLARTGYKAQQSPEPETPGRPDNIYAPVGPDRGAHGRFDDEAHSHSAQVWATTHRAALGGAVGAAAAVALAASKTGSAAARRVWGSGAARAAGTTALARRIRWPSAQAPRPLLRRAGSVAQGAARRSSSAMRRFGATVQ